jgi:thiol-disulfide isomerase/thioredoxin
MSEITDPRKVTRLLASRKPIVIFFYWESCGHCRTTMPHWENLTKMNFPYDFVKVESNNIPAELGIRGFPYFVVRHADGKEESVEGSKSSVEDLISSLHLKKAGGLRRLRRTRRRSSRLTRRRR